MPLRSQLTPVGFVFTFFIPEVKNTIEFKSKIFFEKDKSNLNIFFY